MKSSDGRFERREFTTRGSDPTTCVEWKNIVTGDTLTEFQTVIVGTGALEGQDALFIDLENEFQAAHFDDIQDDYDGDPIYGGE